MSTVDETGNGFFTFYREYAHTAIHTVTATALTAFGLLTFVHWGFVVLAIAVYVLPPIYLYLIRDGEVPKPVGENGDADDEEAEAGGSTERVDASTGSARTAATGKTVPSDAERSNTSAGANRNEGSTAEPDVSGSAPKEPMAVNPEAGRDDDTASAETPDRATTERDSAKAGAGDETETGRTETDEVERIETAKEPDDDTGNEAKRDDRTERVGVGGRTEEADGSERVEESEEGEPADADSPAEWVEVDSPTEATLLDTVAVGAAAYAVGEDGLLLARDEEWEIALEHGPAAESTTLRGVDTTDDGNAVWVAGDSGVLGRYDSTTTHHTDHSAPEGITDNWADLAVAGPAGEERVCLVNGSGEVLLGEYDGSTVEWDEPVKPGSGSSMSAVEFVDESVGYCCDTNAGVYRIDGEEFERIGIEDASGFGALSATEETVAVAGDGTVQRFTGSVWTPVHVAEAVLADLDTDGTEWLAAGADGGIYEQQGGDWEARELPTELSFYAVAIGDQPTIVGEDGTILERL